MDTSDASGNIHEKLIQHISKLSKTDNSEDFIDTLENLNALLISSTYKTIRDVAAQLDLTNLFHEFNTVASDDCSSQLLSVFGMFLEALPPDQVLVQCYDCVLEGLNSKNIVIVELWIKKVVSVVFANESMMKHVSINAVPLIVCVVRLFTTVSTPISLAAHNICVSAAKNFRIEFFSPVVQEELIKLKNYSGENGRVDKDTLKVRFSELCINICCTNQLLLDMINSAGLLQDILNEFEKNLSDDPLIALNMIKLMTDLASHAHGLDYLKRFTSVIQSIAKKIETASTDQLFGALLLPGLINFFVRVAEFDLNIFKDYPAVFNIIIDFTNYKAHNSDFVILGIDSIAYICRKNEGKALISLKIENILQCIVWMIHSGVSELKSRSLSALNDIFNIPDSDPGNKSCQLTELWYGKLESLNCGLSNMIDIAREPFLDHRLSSLHFIRILAVNAWGQKIMSSTPNFMDFLLDQSEPTKEGREAKYEILRELAMSPFIRLSFPPEAILSVRSCLKNGPVTKDPTVAFENAS